MTARVTFTLALKDLKVAYGYGPDASVEEILAHCQLAVVHGHSERRLLICDEAKISTVKGECREIRR